MEQQQANLMGNGMPPQNMMMSSMQRPQSGNIEQQMHAKIMDDLRQKIGTIPPGWQTTFDLGQRASRIMQLVTSLRMLHQEPMKCVQIAENFEDRTLQDSPNKEIYNERMMKKMNEIYQRRQQAVAAARANQMGMPMNNNNMGMSMSGMGNMNNMNNMQNLGMGGGMNMNNMGMNINMGNNGMGMGMPMQMGGNGQQNPNFPAQLQRQMQPSPIPPQQNQQPQNNTLDPSALQNPQMSQQMMQQQQMMSMNQSMPQQTPRPNQLPNRNMNGQAQVSVDPTQQEVISRAQIVFNGLPEDKKNALRTNFLSNLNEQQRAQAQKGGDPLFKYLMGKSREALMKQRQQALMNSEAGQNGGAPQMGNNMGNANNAQQTAVSKPGAPNFDFSSIMGQQQNAIKSQESGEQVVPASNNPTALSGQTNVNQGVNPQQLLTNQNNQGGSNPNQMQQFLAMQQQQQRLAQEKQRQMAQNQMQQQAMAQQAQTQNQLRGQPGGLNAPNALNGGQVNSPAMNMNMLNRPMAPPGQNTPSTPQPNRQQQGMPPTPVNPVNQLAQHHQSMVNQNNVQLGQGGQGQNLQQQIMMSKFPPGIKEKLINLPPQQQNAILARIRNNPQSYAAFVHGLQNGTMPQLGMGTGDQQIGTQQQMMPGVPPNVSTAVPAFNSQPPPNQEQGQQGANGQAALSQAQKMQQHQQMLMRTQAFDEGNFAPPAPQNLGIKLPPEAKTWGDMKRHIQQHQGVLPPNLLEKLHQFQSQWYNAHPEDVQKAMIAYNAKVQQAKLNQQALHQQQLPPSARPPSAQPVPNGQAPPAQMVPPNAQMQQGNQNAGIPNMNLMQIRTPTAEEIMSFKQRIPNARNMTDENIRAIMMRRMQQQKAQEMQQEEQQQQNMRRAQALANGGQPPAAQQQQPPPPPPPQQASQPAQQQQAAKQQANMQGQKRQQSGSDDVMEIPNPNQQQMNAPQRLGMPPNQQMPKGVPMKMPTQADLDKLDPHNKMLVQQRMKQMDALRKAQSNANNQNTATLQQQPVRPQQPSTVPQQQQTQAQQSRAQSVPPEIRQLDDRIKALWNDVQRTTPKGPPIQLDSDGLEQVRNSLKRLWQPLANLDRTFYPALRAPQLGEERVKEAMRAKIIVSQNAADKNGNTKDYLAVSPIELKKHEVFISQYFTALKELKARQDAARAQQAASAGATQAQQPQAQPAAQPAKPTAPPAPARKPSQQSHARKQSAANKAPPAPTDNTKTFDWGAQSPQGVPKYDPTQGQLTQEKLKLPATKKRKTQQPESSESTPAAQTTTPQPASSSQNVVTTKAQAAEQAKKMQVQPKVEAPRFKCDDSMCEGSIRGFETQEVLKQHKETVHKPIEDPFGFLEEALTAGEKSLKAEKPIAAPKAAAQPRGKPMPTAVARKEEQTPDVKTEIATPARPGSSFGKAAAKPTPTPSKKGGDAKAPDSAVQVASVEKEKTLLESMAAKISFGLPVYEAPHVTEAPVDVTDELFEQLFMNGANDVDGNIFASDWNDFSDITDWGLRPSPDHSPDLTPSDGTSQSSHGSDISQSERLKINFEWDAFGNGDTGVPDVLMQTLGLAEGEKKDGEGDGGKKSDEWNWGNDLMDWDSMFGANAGLEEDSMGEGMVF